jgi:hypothetical protein
MFTRRRRGCVTRTAQHEHQPHQNLAPARKPPTPEAAKPLRTHGNRDRTPAQPAVINVGRGQPTGSQRRWQHALNQQLLRAGRRGTAAQDERPQSTPLVLGTRLSPLLEGLGPLSARPRPGPDGSRPRRTNSARTTSRPVTRISRITGDTPPTPYHVLGTRRTQLSTRTTPSPDTAGPTGASGDSDTTAKARPQ